MLLPTSSVPLNSHHPQPSYLRSGGGETVSSGGLQFCIASPPFVYQKQNKICHSCKKFPLTRCPTHPHTHTHSQYTGTFVATVPRKSWLSETFDPISNLRSFGSELLVCFFFFFLLVLESWTFAIKSWIFNVPMEQKLPGMYSSSACKSIQVSQAQHMYKGRMINNTFSLYIR